jgi:hypothetical protein
MLDWNWFQIMENNMDTAHQGILHFGAVPYEEAIIPELAQKAYPGPVEDLKYIVRQRSPRFSVRETEFGLSYDGWRNAEPGVIYHRTMHWLWPWYSMFPVQKLGTTGQVNICVPIDDTHTMTWNLSTGRVDGSADGQRTARVMSANGIAPANGGAPANAPATALSAANGGTLPNTADWLGRFRTAFWEETKASGNFDFGIDREVQKTSHTATGYTGLATVPIQDAMINYSQGFIVDRSREHLGTTDSAIIRTRRMMLNAARALREDGVTPPGVEQPNVYRQRSGWVHLPEGVDYWEETRYMREAFYGLPAAPAPYTPSPMELEKAPSQTV